MNLEAIGKRQARAGGGGVRRRRAPGGGAVLEPERHNRIRWRCRRGMLENDLVLARFLDTRGPTLTDAEVAALDRLLDLADNDLWDLITGRMDLQDPVVAPLLLELRAA